ncbi:hypothetical protein [Spirosoma agri]|uniref:Uncharacterized protein n=1 Tax=Spirosoma agri TaxID=1987381 RepID=A0A6M0IIV8_9BACT|nr:hypothetical protein [Spirosoma agri]NEU67787.1 hypothetical protein [Spirosoma agri]
MNNTLSVRALTHRVVTHAAILWNEPRSEVYARIYAKLLYYYGIDLGSYPRSKNESLLCVAERIDVIDKVYRFAEAENLYLPLAEN